ncbi:MAG: HPr(Ser) kinase/phosphatase [Burkholderiaceae bacterium]
MTMTVARLFAERKEVLGMVLLSDSEPNSREISTGSMEPADLVGHLNMIHPGRIHVIGAAEMKYIERLEPVRGKALLKDLINGAPPALVFAENLAAPASILREANKAGISVFGSSETSARVIESLRSLLARANAAQTSLHGVFMDVLGMGVLISGQSGLGKSELALELISRGHGLVADDVVELSRISSNAIEGRCPPLLMNLLEVRGLGLLDIKAIFGETAVRRRMRLKLIVQLVKRSDMVDDAQRLPLQAQTQNVLGLPVRTVVVPVAAGRNLAVLTEGAVRSTVLQLRGIDTTAEFVERQRQAIASDTELDY